MIEDLLKARGENTARQYYHLHPLCNIRKISSNMIEIENKGCFLYMVLDEAFSLDLKKGKETPILGWSSEAFGTKTENLTLVNTALFIERRSFITFLYVTRERSTLKQLRGLLEAHRRCYETENHKCCWRQA